MTQGEKRKKRASEGTMREVGLWMQENRLGETGVFLKVLCDGSFPTLLDCLK